MTPWPVERLGDLCDIKIGKTPSRARPDFWGPGFPWLSIADMNQGHDLVSTRESITERAILEANHNLVVPGTVLMSFKLSIGKIGIARVAMYTNEAIAHLPVKNKSRLLPEYFYWALRAANLSQGADRAAMGSTLNSSKLRDITIPVPSIEVQQRIAEVLDSAEALLAKRRASIVHLDTLTQSIFLDMFSGDCMYDFIETTVADVADTRRGAIRTGPFGSQLLHSEFRSSGVAVLGIDNAVDNEFKWGKPRYISMAKYRTLERYTVHPGDVLITIMGTCGRCAIVPDDIPLAINTKHLCCISLNRNRCLPEFLQAYFLIHPIARKYLLKTAKGAVMDGLNMGLIKEMPLRLPAAHLQQVFVDRAAAVIEQRLKYRSSLAGLDALFASLQHRAFRGEL